MYMCSEKSSKLRYSSGKRATSLGHRRWGGRLPPGTRTVLSLSNALYMILPQRLECEICPFFLW